MKLKPSGYVPVIDDTPEKFKSRMKRRIAHAEAEYDRVGQPPVVVTPVEERTPPLTIQLGGTLED